MGLKVGANSEARLKVAPNLRRLSGVLVAITPPPSPMLPLLGLRHVAIICFEYAASKCFYTEILGLEALAETHRAARDTYKPELAVNGRYVLELFSFPNPPPHPSYAEAAGRRITFFANPDGPPLEFYEA